MTTQTSNPLELLGGLGLHGLLHHRSLLLCQGIVVNQKIGQSDTMSNSFCSRSADTEAQAISDSVDASQTVGVR